MLQKNNDIRPLGNNVLVDVVQVKTSFALVEDTKTEKGTVTAVGPDVKNIHVGDTIYFKHYAMDEITDEGVTYTLIEESEIKLVESVCTIVPTEQ